MKTVNDFVESFASQHASDLTNLDAQLLLAHVLGHPRVWLLAHKETHLTPPQLDEAEKAFARLLAGEPLPYILGHWEFFGLDFNVTKDVLIPRPETELLVEKAISRMTNRPEARSVADVGTGSGIIAVTLAAKLPHIRILATDISPAALKVAKANAKKHNVADRIEFIEADLLPEKSRIDLLCANLPYIPTQTLRGLPIFGREPTLALDGGPDGLDIYRRLFTLSKNHLTPTAMLLCEIEETQGNAALELAHEVFPNAFAQIEKDLTGRDRLLEIQLQDKGRL
jgi:release factor glutamine methyltransferase